MKVKNTYFIKDYANPIFELEDRVILYALWISGKQYFLTKEQIEEFFKDMDEKEVGNYRKLFEQMEKELHEQG